MISRRGGFTLVEVLVVVFIVSIMTGIAVVNLPSFVVSDDFDTEARRLHVVMEMMRDEALDQVSEYGFRSERSGYSFFRYDELEQTWVELSTRPFEPRTLPESIVMSLSVEGTPLTLGLQDETSPTPPVLILSSGEITPFELTIREPRGTLQQVLLSDGYGALEWQHEQDDEQED